MKLNWEQFVGKTLNITMHENYGLVNESSTNSAVYEIVFKSGTLQGAYDDGLLLLTERENEKITIFVPHSSIKCVEIFNF